VPGPEFQYTDDEWAEIAGHQPLTHLDLTQLLLLHRHFIWANLQRIAFDAELARGAPPEPRNLATAANAAMFLWYGLLWVVIEGCYARRIPFRGRMLADIRSLRNALQRGRDAVFHVSPDRYYDERLFEIMNDPESAAKIRRISTGFGRLFLEELDRRRLADRAG
jgi:hypothetical protein